MKFSLFKRIVAVFTLTSLGVSVVPLMAQQVQHLSITRPGGMPGMPVITGISQTTNGVKLTWDGPAGYYQVIQESNGLSAPWPAPGRGTNLVRTATITRLYSNAFFRVAGPAPKYAGAKVCITCHQSVCRYMTNTAHFGALMALPASERHNPSCLVCHTVGYGLPTGFTYMTNSGIETYTTNLAGVQCENCHGPAANHAAAPDDLAIVPRVELAAQVCGGCHTGSHNPTFEEWSSSGHSAVVPDVLSNMGRDPSFIRRCGVCHSGSARIAMLNGVDPSVHLTNDYDIPQTCAVCHNPHRASANPLQPFQIRNPLFSTNNFELTSEDTASVTNFTDQYYTQGNDNINLCAQCHNDRGETYDDTSYAPHHSLQYNLLLGDVGVQQYLPSPYFSPHSGLPSSAFYSTNGTFYLTNQCASCHMQDDSAGKASHTFNISYSVCANCHSTPAYQAQASLAHDLSNQVCQVITSLNRWAAAQTNSTLLRDNVVAWEYQHAGGLTWQANSQGVVTNWSLNVTPTFTGPADQSAVPENIRKARYDLYLILNDGSFGVHNPTYARFLLQSAAAYAAPSSN